MRDFLLALEKGHSRKQRVWQKGTIRGKVKT